MDCSASTLRFVSPTRQASSMGFLLPVACVACSRPGAWVCGACLAELPGAPAALDVDGLGWCRARFPYTGTPARLVTALKYRNAHALVRWLAALLVPVVSGPGLLLPIAVLTWAPTLAARRRARGFDQAEVLARALGVLLGLPCVDLLHRLPGTAQTGANRSARVTGPRFVPRAGRDPPGCGAVLIVDDVITTGATMSSAAAALRSQSDRVVVGVALAHTPRFVDSGRVALDRRVGPLIHEGDAHTS